MSVKTEFRIKNPEIVECEMKITMSMHGWKRVRDTLSVHPVHHCSELWRKIQHMVGEMEEKVKGFEGEIKGGEKADAEVKEEVEEKDKKKV